MEKREAFNTVAQVCANYKGTAQEHQVIREALMALKPIDEVPKKEEIQKDSDVKTNGETHKK